MPKDELEQDDPFALAAMSLPGEQDAASVDLMGRCFIEEFVRLGWEDAQILLLFRDPFYRGPHAVYQAKGAGFIHQLMAQVRQEWNSQ
jgi:hypothetical protein